MPRYGSRTRPRAYRGFYEDDEEEFDEDDTAGTDTDDVEDEAGEEEEVDHSDAVLGEAEEVNNEVDEEVSENFEEAGETEGEEDVQEVTDENLDEEGNELDGDATGDFTVDVDLDEIIEDTEADAEQIETIHDTLYNDVPEETIGLFNQQVTTLPNENGEFEVEVLNESDEDDYENTSYDEPLLGGTMPNDPEGAGDEEDEDEGPIDPEEVELA